MPFSIPPDFVHYFGIAQAQQPPPPPPPCTPSLQWMLRNHFYAFSNDPMWPGFHSTVVAGVASWNQLVWNHTSATAFQQGASSPTVTIALDPSMSDWGQTTWDVIYLNPVIWQHSPAFSQGVVMHELGHARGYGHVNSSCPVSDSIMYSPANPSGAYPAALGPGDAAAAARDIH